MGRTGDSDRKLRQELASLCDGSDDYWSFRGNAAREHAHAYFQYPAMMVPQMQADLLKAVLAADRDITRVFDPFVGSGTALTETMMKGLDFLGFDINPLAILLCRTKIIPFFDDALQRKLKALLKRLDTDTGCRLETTFRGWDKWFRRDVAIRLSRLKRAIVAEEDLFARRFFWVALAETVRLNSNSRTSTFKLHIRPTKERLGRRLAPLRTFAEIASRNLLHLRTAKKVMASRNLLSRGRYIGRADVLLRDASVSSPSDADDRCDLLITSPPYGDNVTTIPYGQHSYLPMQWITLADIDRNATESCLRSTHEIDSRSLGGSRVVVPAETQNLVAISPTLERTLMALTTTPRDRGLRVTAFCRDLNRCIDPILRRLRDRAYMIWIIGNRRVAGLPLPLDTILSELLTARNAKPVARINRIIPTKRMAVRNDIAETMGRETILVFRKG